jgi:hypothetical protein
LLLKLGPSIGRVEAHTLRSVDLALQAFLGLEASAAMQRYV